MKKTKALLLRKIDDLKNQLVTMEKSIDLWRENCALADKKISESQRSAREHRDNWLEADTCARNLQHSLDSIESETKVLRQELNYA